jgi:hypothetical protein
MGARGDGALTERETPDTQIKIDPIHREMIILPSTPQWDCPDRVPSLLGQAVSGPKQAEIT